MKLSPERVMREMRLQRRRKGGGRRAHMEMILDRAWDMAWNDNFKDEVVDYIVKAEVEFQRRIESARKVLRERLIKEGLDPGKL